MWKMIEKTVFRMFLAPKLIKCRPIIVLEIVDQSFCSIFVLKTWSKRHEGCVSYRISSEIKSKKTQPTSAKRGDITPHPDVNLSVRSKKRPFVE